MQNKLWIRWCNLRSWCLKWKDKTLIYYWIAPWKKIFFFQLVFSLSDPTPIHERVQKLQQSGTNASKVYVEPNTSNLDRSSIVSVHTILHREISISRTRNYHGGSNFWPGFRTTWNLKIRQLKWLRKVQFAVSFIHSAIQLLEKTKTRLVLRSEIYNAKIDDVRSAF